jgi:hypothetical protein
LGTERAVPGPGLQTPLASIICDHQRDRVWGDIDDVVEHFVHPAPAVEGAVAPYRDWRPIRQAKHMEHRAVEGALADHNEVADEKRWEEVEFLLIRVPDLGWLSSIIFSMIQVAAP